jgi:hypothetical protein
MTKGVRKLKNIRKARQFKGFFEEKLQRKLTIKELEYIRWLSSQEKNNSDKIN